MQRVDKKKIKKQNPNDVLIFRDCLKRCSTESVIYIKIPTAAYTFIRNGEIYFSYLALGKFRVNANCTIKRET